MDKELALRAFGYLIGHYKTHNETTINKQEIEAIEFMLKNNANLEQQCKKQKEIINKTVLELANIDGTLSNSQLSDRICNLIDILQEVSE